jgi:hypothetical protein
MFDDDDFDTGIEEEMTVDQNRLGGMLAYGYLLVTSLDCFETVAGINARLEDLFNEIESELDIQRSKKGVKVVSFQRVTEPTN